MTPATLRSLLEAGGAWYSLPLRLESDGPDDLRLLNKYGHTVVEAMLADGNEGYAVAWESDEMAALIVAAVNATPALLALWEAAKPFGEAFRQRGPDGVSVYERDLITALEALGADR